MGSIEGRTGRAHTQPAGPELLIDGAASPGGLRQQIDLRELGPIGSPRIPFRQIDWAPVDDAGNNRVDVNCHWGGKGRIHPDAGGSLPGLHPNVNPLLGAQDFAILDPNTVGGTGLLITALEIEQEGITGFVTAPTVSLGTNAPNYDNIIGQTLLAMASQADQRSHILRPHDWSGGVGPTSQFVPSGTTVFFRVHAGASATTMTIRPFVIGYVLR